METRSPFRERNSLQDQNEGPDLMKENIAEMDKSNEMPDNTKYVEPLIQPPKQDVSGKGKENKPRLSVLKAFDPLASLDSPDKPPVREKIIIEDSEPDDSKLDAISSECDFNDDSELYVDATSNADPSTPLKYTKIENKNICAVKDDSLIKFFTPEKSSGKESEVHINVENTFNLGDTFDEISNKLQGLTVSDTTSEFEEFHSLNADNTLESKFNSTYADQKQNNKISDKEGSDLNSTQTLHGSNSITTSEDLNSTQILEEKPQEDPKVLEIDLEKQENLNEPIVLEEKKDVNNCDLNSTETLEGKTEDLNSTQILEDKSQIKQNVDLDTTKVLEEKKDLNSTQILEEKPQEHPKVLEIDLEKQENLNELIVLEEKKDVNNCDLSSTETLEGKTEDLNSTQILEDKSQIKQNVDLDTTKVLEEKKDLNSTQILEEKPEKDLKVLEAEDKLNGEIKNCDLNNTQTLENKENVNETVVLEEKQDCDLKNLEKETKTEENGELSVSVVLEDKKDLNSTGTLEDTTEDPNSTQILKQDLNITEVLEEKKDLNSTETLEKTIVDLDSTQILKEDKQEEKTSAQNLEDKPQSKQEDLNITEVLEEKKDLNSTQTLEETIKELNSTQTLEETTENKQKEDLNITKVLEEKTSAQNLEDKPQSKQEDFNITEVLEEKKDLNSTQTLEETIKELNSTKTLEEKTENIQKEDLNITKVLDEKKDLNSTQILEEKTEDKTEELNETKVVEAERSCDLNSIKNLEKEIEVIEDRKDLSSTATSEEKTEELNSTQILKQNLEDTLEIQQKEDLNSTEEKKDLNSSHVLEDKPETNQKEDLNIAKVDYKKYLRDMESYSEQQKLISDLKLQLNASQQAKATLELEIRQKEEIVIKIQAESFKKEEEFKAEIKELKEKIKENSKLIEKSGSKELEDALKEAKDKAAQAMNELMTKNKEELNYQKIMEEYENSLSAKHAEYEKLKEEHNTALRHLSNLEFAFSDVHQKYERSKASLIAFKTNEETLQNNFQAMENLVKSLEERYESLKTHAKNQIEKSNKEILLQRKMFEERDLHMNARVKRLDIKCKAFEVSLEQKTNECLQLAALCDEVTGKKM